MSGLKNIWANFKGKTITLVAGCFLSFVALFVAISFYTDKLSRDISNEWDSEVVIIVEEGKTYVIDNDELNYKVKVKKNIVKDKSFTRIISYLNEVKRRHYKHDKTMIFFYELYFVFNMMQAFMIMSTTIIGLVISKYGWEKINKDVMYIFFIIAGFMAFTKLVPEFMKVEDNIASNKKCVIVYSNIEQSIISYLSTGENSKGVEITPVRYVHLLDKEMNNNNKIAFDIEKIPDQEFDFSKKD